MSNIPDEWLDKEIKRHAALETLGFHEAFNPIPTRDVVVCPSVYLPPIDESCYVDITEEVKKLEE